MEEQNKSILMCHFGIGLWAFGLIYFLLSTDLCIKIPHLGQLFSVKQQISPVLSCCSISRQQQSLYNVLSSSHK